MRSLRLVFFWAHLVTGVAGGLLIAIMSATGALLAFETEIVAWADGPSAKASATATPKPLDELVARVRAERPDVAITALTLKSAPGAAPYVALGRDDGRYVDPFTGEVRVPGGARWRAAFDTIEGVHRTLGATGPRRDTGKAFTGAANLGFVSLTLTGLWLWWPRRWALRALRPVVWFRRGLAGKARDFNWHTTIGLWCALVLAVVSVSGAVISYRWASDLVYRAAGETPPAPAPTPARLPAPSPDAEPLPIQALVARVSAEAPAWEAITLRAGNAPFPGAGRRGEAAAAVSFTVRDPSTGPRFTSRSFTLHPFTAEVLKAERYADATPGRRARIWLRFLHTGQALGVPGQVAAAIASLGALVLVWTGFALSFRRFFRHRAAEPRPAAKAPSEQAAAPGE